MHASAARTCKKNIEQEKKDEFVFDNISVGYRAIMYYKNNIETYMSEILIIHVRILPVLAAMLRIEKNSVRRLPLIEDMTTRTICVNKVT